MRQWAGLPLSLVKCLPEVPQRAFDRAPLGIAGGQVVEIWKSEPEESVRVSLPPLAAHPLCFLASKWRDPELTQPLEVMVGEGNGWDLLVESAGLGRQVAVAVKLAGPASCLGQLTRFEAGIVGDAVQRPRVLDVVVVRVEKVVV